MPAIPALWKLRQGDGEFEACLGYIARLYLKTQGLGWDKAQLIKSLPCMCKSPGLSPSPENK
jgi:hypothetical protein